MKPVIAAVLNFFFAGLGTLLFGRRKVIGACLTLSAGALTYVELALQTISPSHYWVMFGAVFLMNTALAVDGFREAKEVAAGR